MAVGEIVGGFVNGAVNFINAQQQRELERELQQQKQRAVQNALAQSNTEYQKMMNLLGDYDANRMRLADDSMVQQYKDLISNYEPSVYDFDKFSYDKTVEDFMNPMADKIANLAGLETQASQAGAGAAGGTGAMAGMGYSRWKAAEDLYKDAQAQMNADRSQAYQEYGDYITNMQNKLNTISQGQLNKASLLGGAITNEQQQQSDYMADLLGIMGDKASTNVNATIGAF
jgi:hypothetical protein